jgi:chromosome segregation ATPase
MTVVKRQAQSPAGVSSEVEVLKALKSLFEHHKALDEKVRERLRVSLDRVSALEEELAKTNEELVKSKQLQQQQQQQIQNISLTAQMNESAVQMNGALDEDEKTREMQCLVEKQTNDLINSRNKLQELTNKLKDYEEMIVKTDKELAQLKEENVKLNRDLKENNAQKEDQEERIATLEKRYLNAQRESTSLHDLNEKLEHELSNKEQQLKLAEDKIRALAERLELADQKIAQFTRKQEIITDGTQENEFEIDDEQKLSLEERIVRLEQQLEEKAAELLRARQREKMNEDHNQRLSATVDKLLAESNERLQLHLKERMSALEEKNTMTQELERLRKLLDETQSEKGKILQEFGKMRVELETQNNLRTDNIDVNSLARNQRLVTQDNNKNKQLFEHEWEKLEPRVIANVNQAFDVSDTECSQTDDNESIFDTMDILSPSGHTDAQTLAIMLQEQLDAINNEIRLIQEEKQNTEQRAEELESQVGSIDSMSLLTRGCSFERGISPPQSGRSTPKSNRISPSREYLSQLYVCLVRIKLNIIQNF